MKYREISSHISGAKELIGTVMLKDGVVEYDGISQSQIDLWEEDGIEVSDKVFKPQEQPEFFFRWLQLEDTSYSKTSPIYDDGEE
jgi:hypothetical protein